MPLLADIQNKCCCQLLMKILKRATDGGLTGQTGVRLAIMHHRWLGVVVQNSSPLSPTMVKIIP